MVIPHDIKDTQCNSGWLSPRGEWYPCEPFGHISLVFDLYESKVIEEDDEDTMEKCGWTKIKGGRVFYFSDRKPTEAIITALFDYMDSRNLDRMELNGDMLSVTEVVDLDWPLAMWKEI